MKPGILCLVTDPSDAEPLHALQEEWDVVCVAGGGTAMEKLRARPFDVVLADFRLIGKDGMHFLTYVMNEHPQLTRILLFDAVDRQCMVRTDGVAQQCVSRPLAAALFAEIVQRARLLNTWLTTPPVKRLFPLMRKMPSVPAVYFQLVQALQSPNADLEDVGKIIAQDMVMTARVLQLVNSAFFALGHSITRPAEAVAHLGLERTKALVLLTHAFRSFEENHSGPFSIEKLWAHSLRVGQLAQWIVRQETGDAALAEAAFTAGVLHDVGKLMLAVNLPEDYARAVRHAREQGVPFTEAENAVWGVTHATLGACVLGIWGLPVAVVEAIAYHHAPGQHAKNGLNVTTALHLAEVLDHEQHPADADGPHEPLDLEYFKRAGLETLPDRWREMCGQR